MSGRIIAFQLPPGTPQVKRVQFNQKFWGQTTSSWGGKYRYRRRGFMEDIPHRKLLPGVVLTRADDGARVQTFLEDKVEPLYVRRVDLIDEDEIAFEQGWPGRDG